MVWHLNNFSGGVLVCLSHITNPQQHCLVFVPVALFLLSLTEDFRTSRLSSRSPGFFVFLHEPPPGRTSQPVWLLWYNPIILDVFWKLLCWGFGFRVPVIVRHLTWNYYRILDPRPGRRSESVEDNCLLLDRFSAVPFWGLRLPSSGLLLIT